MKSCEANLALGALCLHLTGLLVTLRLLSLLESREGLRSLSLVCRSHLLCLKRSLLSGDTLRTLSLELLQQLLLSTHTGGLAVAGSLGKLFQTGSLQCLLACLLLCFVLLALSLGGLLVLLATLFFLFFGLHGRNGCSTLLAHHCNELTMRLPMCTSKQSRKPQESQ